MRDNHDNAVELLGYAQLAVLSATNGNARAVKANLGAVLRKACRGSPLKIARLSDAVLAESEFLRDMAWTDDASDSGVFEAQRQRFAAAMDRLIYEVGVTRIRPLNQVGEAPVLNSGVSSSQRFALAKVRLAATLMEWASKARRGANRSMVGQLRPVARRQTRSSEW